MSHTSSRRIAAAITTAVTALGLGLVAPTGATGGAATAASRCADAPSQGKVRPGADVVDPNSVSTATARAMERELRARTARLSARGMLTRREADRALVRVRTVVHVITRDDGTGGVTRQQVVRQIRVLNRGYRGDTSPRAANAHFRFVLRRVDRTANDDWYAWDLNLDGTETDAVREAKRALHRGTRATLNIYVAGLQDGFLGYSTFPQDDQPKLDGVVVLNESLPGGAEAPYNRGDTATHEVGHWLGLFHTFQGGCDKPGDHVRDTAYQLDGSNVFDCNESADTCAQPGNDPVHNFMSYAGDACLDKFTRGQSQRMRRAWFAHRG